MVKEMKEGFELVDVSEYVHLHNHTHYSLLDGLQKVDPMLDRVRELGMSSVAITDHGTMSGAIEFYKLAKAKGIKPIIGMETYIAERSLTDKEPGKDKNNYHLTLLAMNNQGYQNLMRLATVASLDGFYYRPRIDRSTLEKYSDGLIVLSGCIGGELGDALRQDQNDKAKKTAQWYKKVFGDRYYIELQDHGHPKHPSVWAEQTEVNKKLLKLARSLDIPPVVTCDAHYLNHDDQEAHEVLLCVQTGSFLSDTSRMSLKNFELHLTDPKDINMRWQITCPEAITNTAVIAERCSVELDLGKILIPKFSVPKGQTEQSYLQGLVFQGLAWRYAKISVQKAKKLDVKSAKRLLPGHILDRAEYELGVVDQMNFNSYFLIISDFIGWGKDKGIVFGPGRGSAAGSIIAYALNITELDPLKYDLLFERFLNPDRISMPDIDIDIQDSRRDEVIQYCIQKYGADRVANIVTFGRMAARNAVRDVSRVLQVPYSEADRLAKMIPPPVQGRHIPLEASLKSNPDLAREYAASDQTKRLFDLAIKLEGTIRSHGVHAAGVVIAPGDIVDYVPLEMAQKGVVATQYSMGPIEDLGLLKIDFLGLSNLTIIKNALRIIKKVHDVQIDINLVPLDDAKTFGLLQKGETTGVFQLESAGMKRYLKDLKPTLFEDIVAMVALYRPGPMQFIDDFIARKHGQRRISYFHPKMKAALKNTYGVLVYQEQVMQISKDMCGFTGGQADTLRKGIAKKIPEVLDKMKIQFIEGAIKHSDADADQMEMFWNQLEDFAAYCFNKSHAACYAMIAYQTAYLKAHYPAAFMAAVMTSDFDNTDRLSIEINECSHMGLEVLPPDINESFVEFAVVPGKKQIRFGMAAIKNVGVGAVEEIIAARAHGKFVSLEDFLTRVSGRVINRKVLENLIKAGALSDFGERGMLLDNIDNLLGFGAKKIKDEQSGQTDLFGDKTDSSLETNAKISLLPGGHYETSQYLTWERELLGLYLSEHPLKVFKTLLDETTVPINQIVTEMDGSQATIGGVIISTRAITTKNGKQMAFVKLGDLNGEVEIMVFPKLYEENPAPWADNTIVRVTGKIDSRSRDGSTLTEPKLLASRVEVLTAAQATGYKSTGRKKAVPKIAAKATNSSSQPSGRLYIRVFDSADQEKLNQLKSVLDANVGSTEVVLVTGDETQKKAIRIPHTINSASDVFEQLEKIFGEKNVVLS